MIEKVNGRKMLGADLGKDKQGAGKRSAGLRRKKWLAGMPNGHGGFRKCWFPLLSWYLNTGLPQWLGKESAYNKEMQQGETAV